MNYAPPCWVVDGAHQPDPFYAQYILTGDYFYLEEMQMWAGMMTLAYSPGYSGNTVGIIDQVRGDAWVFRNRMNAAFATPDDETTLKAFFNQITDDALAFWEGQASITGGSFQGAAEWQWAHANSHLPTNPLHFWGSNSGAPYTDATWMHYYFITTLGMATERGFASGPMLSYVGTVLTNQAVAANYNPYNIATYWINTSDPSGNWYPDWSSIQTANVALGYMHATGDFGVTSNGDPTYVMLATGAASYLTHEPNGSAAWSFLNQNFRQPALQGGLGSGVYKDGTGEINWNILPRP